MYKLNSKKKSYMHNKTYLHNRNKIVPLLCTVKLQCKNTAVSFLLAQYNW